MELWGYGILTLHVILCVEGNEGYEYNHRIVVTIFQFVFLKCMSILEKAVGPPFSPSLYLPQLDLSRLCSGR